LHTHGAAGDSLHPCAIANQPFKTSLYMIYAWL